MDSVIIFNKSMEERFEEYRDVFAGNDLPVSAIKKKWVFYLELTVDTTGWQAIWKIQRNTCEILKIPFPSVVLVRVLKVDFEQLTAVVDILGVQDDIHIPDKHYVPLQQLWPTREQDQSVALNLDTTANSLDMLRFFYNHLFMPWDDEDGDTVDWKTEHLETRLRLFYDLKNGVLPRAAAEHLHNLLTEAKTLQVKQECLESELQDSVDFNQQDDNGKVQALMELRIRMMEIQGELNIIENPLLRTAIIKKYKDMSPVHNKMKQNIWLIYSEGPASGWIECLSKVERIYPSEMLKLSHQLIWTLQWANSNDIFILSETTHQIKTTGALEHGGILKGISTADKTILASEVEDVMLDFRGGNVVIENITIEATSSQCAIIVRKGYLTLRNCKLVGDGKSSAHQGIIILGGGNLEIVNCEISNFYTAVVGNSGSTITVENSEFHHCNFGFKIHDNCVVKAIEATIHNCRDYGICIETGNNWNEENHHTVGGFDILNINPKFKMGSIEGTNNIKGDVVIYHKSQLQGDFENPEMDPATRQAQEWLAN